MGFLIRVEPVRCSCYFRQKLERPNLITAQGTRHLPTLASHHFYCQDNVALGPLCLVVSATELGGESIDVIELTDRIMASVPGPENGQL